MIIPDKQELTVGLLFDLLTSQELGEEVKTLFFLFERLTPLKWCKRLTVWVAIVLFYKLL